MKSQPSKTTQIQEVRLPAWVDAASQANYKQAQELGERPHQPYAGERVAGMTPLEQAAGGTLAAGQATTNSALQQALAAAGAAGNYDPSQVTAPGGVGDVAAGSFLSRDINAYMDPNINSVVNTTLQGMDRNIAQGQNSINDAAHAAGAFGGSRHGVQAGVLAAEGARAKAATEAGLRSQAYQDAAGRIQSDNATALQAALANQASGLTTQGQSLEAQRANQGAGLAAAGLGLQGGQLALGTGQAASDTAGRNAILQSQLGATERGLNQAELDTKYASFLEQRDYPLEQLNMQLAALGMSPYGKQSTTTTTNPPQQGNPLLTGIGAAASILPLLFGSDRKIKKNVKRIGKVPGTKLNAYEYDYKKGFLAHNTGRTVGLMAQDVEKKVPSAVQKVTAANGQTIKAVNYKAALAGGRIGIGSRMAA